MRTLSMIYRDYSGWTKVLKHADFVELYFPFFFTQVKDVYWTAVVSTYGSHAEKQLDCPDVFRQVWDLM